MPFVKMDCGFLNSTLWFDKEARDVFLTALLMAEPHEAKCQYETYTVDTGEATGFVVPPGWYGFVHAAGSAIIRYAMADEETGVEALKRLAGPDPGSRTPDFEGRRMVRINGGFLILNFQKHRDRDYTSAARSARYRERKKKRHGVASASHTVASRDITQAEAEAEAEAKKKKTKTKSVFVKPALGELEAYIAEKKLSVDATAFYANYESKAVAGKWMIGKVPMSNWKMALWTWERRGSDYGQTR